MAASATDETTERIQKARSVLTAMTDSKHSIPADKLAAADCVAVIPGFKKGAAGIGFGFGKGFISCRTASGWSAPGAIAFQTESLGAQFGGEEIDIVILSLDKTRRAKLLSDRFTVGEDASAAWDNGKSAHGDPNAKVLFYGRTKGVFAGFGLDGATLKPDASGDKTLYGKAITNAEVVKDGVETPAAAQPLIAILPR